MMPLFGKCICFCAIKHLWAVSNFFILMMNICSKRTIVRPSPELNNVPLILWVCCKVCFCIKEDCRDLTATHFRNRQHQPYIPETNYYWTTFTAYKCQRSIGSICVTYKWIFYKKYPLSFETSPHVNVTLERQSFFTGFSTKIWLFLSLHCVALYHSFWDFLLVF